MSSLEDLEQQRRPLVGDEDCRRWTPGCSCSSSDDDEDEEEEEKDDEEEDGDEDDDDEGVSIGRIVRIFCTAAKGKMMMKH